MSNKIHKGQGAVWIILIIAIVALIALWISKNPAISPNTTSNPAQTTPEVTVIVSTSPTPTQSLQDIDKSLKQLNTDSKKIDDGINDTQLDLSI